jgi:hypothetical protein
MFWLPAWKVINYSTVHLKLIKITLLASINLSCRLSLTSLICVNDVFVTIDNWQLDSWLIEEKHPRIRSTKSTSKDSKTTNILEKAIYDYNLAKLSKFKIVLDTVIFLIINLFRMLYLSIYLLLLKIIHYFSFKITPSHKLIRLKFCESNCLTSTYNNSYSILDFGVP